MGELTPERWGRIRSLLESVLEVPASARPALLNELCGDDDVLRAEIDALLAAEARADRLLDAPVGEVAQLLVDEIAQRASNSINLAGRPVGPYRLVREIARGGMGTVCLAERDDGQFEQRVAVKLLRHELDTEVLLRRFLAERQILASLSHPNIARLLDGGATEDGQPYLVMEYVEGRAIDAYCDAHRLTVRERLSLFLTVAKAVQHAHGNLVVHSDLKPSNILVTDAGEVKLLDFGIAKLLPTNGEEGGGKPRTSAGLRLMTPEYAAPEQVKGEAVSTASDVYQLGLLLYESLTGRRAHRLQARTPAEIERSVCEDEPPRPSGVVTRETQTHDGAPSSTESVARARRTTPERLRKDVDGDLDAITLKALRKEPERRYPSVAELISDVERHLDGRPVEARPDTLTYRFGRFLYRHRIGASAAALLLALLVAYAVTVTLQAGALARERDRAEAEAMKAQQVKALVLRLFEGADPREARGEGLYGEAEPLHSKALELARTLEPREPLLLAGALRASGRLRFVRGDAERGDYDAADELLDDALALYRGELGDTSAEVAVTLGDMGWAANWASDYARAEALFRESLAMRRQLFSDEHRDVAESLATVGAVLWSRGDYAGAEPFLRQALELRRRLLPDDHPDLAGNLTNLAVVRRSLGDPESAETLHREALDLLIRTRGEEHRSVANVMNNLAVALWDQRDLEGAESFFRRALAIRRRTLGERHPNVASNLSNIGEMRFYAGDLDGAEELFDEALSIYPLDHRWRPHAIDGLGLVHEARGDYRAAERLYREALSANRALYGDNHEQVGVVLNHLGNVLYLRGDLDAAESYQRQAIDIFRGQLPDDHYRIAEALLPLGEILLDTGRTAEARAMLEEALDIRRTAFGDEDSRTVEVTEVLDRIPP